MTSRSGSCDPQTCVLTYAKVYLQMPHQDGLETLCAHAPPGALKLCAHAPPGALKLPAPWIPDSGAGLCTSGAKPIGGLALRSLLNTWSWHRALFAASMHLRAARLTTHNDFCDDWASGEHAQGPAFRASAHSAAESTTGCLHATRK